MGLQDREWLPRYDSKVNNVTTEFFIPALSESTVYRRIAGLFSSTSFALCARGIKELIANSGRMQLIASPILTKDDIQALKESVDVERVIERAIRIQLNNVDTEFEKNHIDALKFLLKEGFLEIRIEIPLDPKGQILDMESIIKSNILSEKRGILQDRDGNAISFRGPINESKQSWEKGIFELTVDVDWIDGQRQHVLEDIRIFESKWNNRKGTLPLPQAIKDDLTKTSPSKENINLEKFNVPEWALLPNGAVLWPHQIRAVNAWISNGHKGILTMATGSGKTITAIVASNLAPANMMVLIVVYGKVLVEQWEKEVYKYDKNADIVLCDSDTNWKEILPGKLVAYYTNNDSQYTLNNRRLYVIATPQTAILRSFQDNFMNVSANSLQIIADEVHHLGAEAFSKVFNIDAARRLGLSATYRRDWDDPGTQNILDYFGRSLEEAKYGISEAIKDGRLCKYRYFPFFAYLTADEFGMYVKLSLEIKREFSKLKVKEHSTALPTLPRRLEGLLRNRAEILKKAEDKIRVYREIIASNPKIPYVIFADDNIQASQIEDAHKEQIREMNRMSDELHIDDIMLFSGESDPWQRQRIISEVGRRGTPLLSMYCLDEGIDLPQLKSAIIVSSSTSKRQYIQRRGRILRLGEKGKIAELYDIIVLARPDYDPVHREIAEDIIRKERDRLEELSADAENKYSAILKMDKQIRDLGFNYIVNF